MSPISSSPDRHNVTVATFDSVEKPGFPKPHRFIRRKDFELPVGTLHGRHSLEHVKECVGCTVVSAISHTQSAAIAEERREPAATLIPSVPTHTDGRHMYAEY